MRPDRIYLDFNATAPMRPAVRSRMVDLLAETGNASSIHAEGRRARAIIEQARGEVARLVGARPELVVFTSGATEAAALALTPGLRSALGQGPVDRLLVGATEHPAVATGHRFLKDGVKIVPVQSDGVIDLAALETMLQDGSGRTLLALQAANSETGVLQPVAQAADLVHAQGGLIVCDAVQAAGRIECSFAALRADVILLSAHKLGGPQGVGAMVMGSDALRIETPLVRGGGQERGLRGGTENVLAIAGFGVAAREIASRPDVARLSALRDGLEGQLARLVPDLAVFGADAPRLPNTTAFAMPAIANETLLMALDLEGIAVSTGSACSSGKVSRSHVLEAMGVDAHLSGGLIRISLGWSSTTADVDRFIEAFGVILQRIRGRAMRSAA